MMTSELKKYCGHLLKHIMYSERALHFREPLDCQHWGLNDYPQFVSLFCGASDLNTIEKKLENGEYNTCGEFADNVRNVFRIGMRYHWRGKEKYKLSIKAAVLMDEFEAQYQLFLRGYNHWKQLQIKREEQDAKQMETPKMHDHHDLDNCKQHSDHDPNTSSVRNGDKIIKSDNWKQQDNCNDIKIENNKGNNNEYDGSKQRNQASNYNSK